MRVPADYMLCCCLHDKDCISERDLMKGMEKLANLAAEEPTFKLEVGVKIDDSSGRLPGVVYPIRDLMYRGFIRLDSAINDYNIKFRITCKDTIKGILINYNQSNPKFAKLFERFVNAK